MFLKARVVKYAKEKKLLAVSGKRTVMDNEDLNTYSNIRKVFRKTIEIESALDIPYLAEWILRKIIAMSLSHYT